VSSVSASRALRTETMQKTYLANQTVPASGIYRVIHQGHAGPEELVLIRNASFPACTQCRKAVKYELIHAAPHLSEDEDFKAS
jgi:hypothetical protein